MTTTVLLFDSQADEIKRILKQSVTDIEFVEDLDDPESVRRSSIWLGTPDKAAKLLAKGFKPQWLQSTWAGIRPLLADRLPTDYRLSRAVGIFGQPIAEYVLARLLEHKQQTRARALSQSKREWNASTPGTLSGSKALIVGAGEIGQAVAGFLRPFGVRLSGIATHTKPVPNFDTMVTMSALHQAAAEADYVINILPDTSATTDVFDDAFFAAINPAALFINVGRGSAVVDRALIRALEQDHLAGAVLDVFREEPLPAAHPFWRTPRLVITGHIAGPTIASVMCELFVDNLRRFGAGEPLKGEVSFLKPY